MFKNVSIKARLIFVIALLGVELVIGAAVGLISLGHANGQMHGLYADRIVRLGQLDQIIRRLDADQLNLAKALTATPEGLSVLLAEIDRDAIAIDAAWKSYGATPVAGEEQAHAARFTQARARFVDQALRPAIEAVRGGDTARATALVHGVMNERFTPVRAAVDDLIRLQLDEAAKTERRSQSTYDLVRAVCLSGMALGLVLAAAVGAMLVRGIIRPLDDAVRVAGAVADGDLTQNIAVTANDETGHLMRALNEMNEGLTRLVGRVRAGTDTIATASGQIAAGNLDLSVRTEQQAASLDETASSMEQLTSTVKQNAENARQANQLALSASHVAGKGGAVVTQVVATMGAINASATQIADIIGVIDDIAFQTNLLALNAAVEAARAGEQGRGFAVVAGEVRTLAQRSASAAKKIKALIEDSVSKVHHGSELVDQAGTTMGEIVQSVDRVRGIMADILAASQEQSTRIQHVNQAVLQMDQSTQQNAALVEQASAAAQALREEASSLADAVGAFRLKAQGGAGKPMALGAPALA